VGRGRGDAGVTGAPEGFAELAGELARASPPAGAGVVAAGVAGLAAGLAESIARASLDSWADASGVAVQALVLRRRTDAAGRDDAEAYATARRWLEQRAAPTAPGRDAMLRAALLAAADALLVITAAAADCATLAAEIAAHCPPALVPDAAAAAELAAAAARVAASLVDVNLALTPGDPRRARARSLVQTAESETRRTREHADGR
jgi:formiminotetrahydrofolate cyclodeaminase